MKKLVFLLWILLAILFSLSFAIVTGIFNPREKVNAIWLITAAACFYILAYRFYGAFLASKIATLNDMRITPAYRLNDGKNFYPTNKWVLFGHHFAAIAGAGPLIGPVLAAQFGYLPGFLWILIGAALAGGVHDFIILTASVRRDGKSLAQIAKEEVGPVTGGAALIAILFILTVAIAGLGLAVINSLFYNPWGTFIIGMTIPIALFMGIYLKSVKPARIGGISLLGFALLFLTVIFGKAIPASPISSLFSLDKNSLTILLAAYGFIASVLPVWLLLAPRDYLSSFMKIGVTLLLACGVIADAPDLKMPPPYPVHPWWRAHNTRNPFPLCFYNNRLWGNIGISFSYIFGHNTENDRERKLYKANRLWSYACGGICCSHGLDCSRCPDSGRLLCHQYQTFFFRACLFGISCP